MQKDELLLDYLLEIKTLRKKLASIENVTEVLQRNEVMDSINIKTEYLIYLLNSCIGQLENINMEKDTTVDNMKNIVKLTEELFKLPCVNHDNFVEMVSTTDEVARMFENIVPQTDDEDEDKDDFSQTFEEFEELNSYWTKRIVARKGGNSSKRLSGVMDQSDEDKNSADKHKNDSDLGCYPHDRTLANIETLMSLFATSSPISKYTNHSAIKELLKIPE